MSGFDDARVLREPLASGLSQLWDLDHVLWEGDTAYQHVVIAKTLLGISLFCDNDPQSAELSQHLYHEALLVPAMLLAERVDRVLLVGSSEGVLSQMAVRAGASRIDHVDIDGEVVRLCAEYLPYGYTPAELAKAERGDGPVRMHYADGWEFVRAAASGQDRYDIVVLDVPGERDDEAQHNRILGDEFLSLCRSVLTPGGVVCAQVGCPTLWLNSMLVRSWRRFHEVFGTVAYFGSDEFDWSFLFGRPDRVDDPTATMIERLAADRYRPTSIDDKTLLACGIPPYSLRHSTR